MSAAAALTRSALTRALACALALLLTGCLDMTPPKPKPELPPAGSNDVKDISLIPPGAAPNGDVGNQAPHINSVLIEPAQPSTSDAVHATVLAEDRDNDHLDIDYLWVINGDEKADLTTDQLGADYYKKGDKLAVKVTVSDGELEDEKTSADVTVVNSPPAFQGDPRAGGQLDGMLLKAKDPDGDPLSFSMSGAPAGMSIDSTQGRIHYKGSEDEKGGAYQITITVDDGDEGTAKWSFGIQVSPGSVAAKKAKEAAEAAAKAADTP